MTARFLIGIDLGTTHTAVCYRDLENETDARLLPIKGKTLYPSVVDNVTSSKSWLFAASHQKDEPLLPFDALSDEDRITPSEAAFKILEQIKNAWDSKFPLFPFEEQSIALGCPASFNERARKLTLMAAEKAGIKAPYLVEEPLAAFYTYLTENPDCQETTILVIDIGGGTTDFTLIEKKSGGYERTAVGEHLLLGGDNMDLLLEAYFEGSEGKRLKENAHQNPEIFKLLCDGFFPQEPLEEAAEKLKHAGLRKGGLPYPSDPILTRHLAKFLKTHSIIPTAVLLAGGVFKADPLKKAVLDLLQSWSSRPIKELPSTSLDYAVAQGAVAFLEAKCGLRAKIAAGCPKNFYLQLREEGKNKAVVILSKGQKEGSCYTLPQPFKILAGTAIEFPLWSSHTRKGDHVGEKVSIDPEEMSLESHVRGVLKFGKSIVDLLVQLEIELTDYGVLKVSLKSLTSSHVWNLEFSARSTSCLSFNEVNTLLDKSVLEEVKGIIVERFAQKDISKVRELGSLLENKVDSSRKSFSLPLLRSIWEGVKASEPRKKASYDYEALWWHWAGFSLRPGFGYPLDPQRVEDFWKIFLATPLSSQTEEARMIATRRAAPGLSRGQQNEVAKRFKKESPEQIRLMGSLEKLSRAEKIKLTEYLFTKALELKADKADYWSLGRLGARHLLCQDLSYVLPAKTLEKWVCRWLDQDIASSEWFFVWSHWLRKTGMKELDLPKTLKTKVIDKMAPFGEVDRLLNVAYQEVELNFEERGEMLGDSLPLGLECAE